MPYINYADLQVLIKKIDGCANKGRTEGTSSVAFEVLIINCQKYFINIKLFIFKLFDIKFLFSENYAFRKQKRTNIYGLMDARP